MQTVEMQKKEEIIKSVASKGKNGDSKKCQVSVSGRGDIKLTGNALIDEVLNGKIIVKGELTISEKGQVVGDVYADNLLAMGSIIGNVFVNNRLIVHSNASCSGNVTAPEAVLYRGSRISGIQKIGTVIEK